MSNDAVAKLIEESRALERSGQEGAAFERARQALELASSENNPDGVASAQVRSGELQYQLGHFEEATHLAEQVLALADKRSRPRVDAFILLGNCSMETGTIDEAEKYYLAAADLSRQISYEQALVSALHDLGACIYALRGQFSLAIAAEEQAYSLACQHGLPQKPLMLISLSFDCLLTGRFQRVKEISQSLAQLASGNLRLYGYELLVNAYLSQAEGDIDSAIGFYERARTVAEITGELGMNVFLRTGLSAYYQITGNYAAAYDWATDAVAWASRTGTRRFLGRALTERGHSSWLKGDLAAAEADLRLAIQDLGFRKQAYDLARAQLILTSLLHQQASAEAETVFIEAASLIISGGYTYLLERERALVFPLIAEYLEHPNPAMQAVTTTLLARLMSVPPATLQIFTFGRFEVYRRGVLIPDAAWRRQAGELFRLLLISPGQTLSRDQIIDNLWPEKPSSRSISFFHQATSCLRRAIEPDLPEKFPSRYLIVEGGQVALYLPVGSQVDYEEFQAYIHREQYDEALQVYRGEPLIKDRYHDWASSKREQLIQMHIKALLETANRDLMAGEFGKALASSQQVLAEEPWNEQAGLIAMKANLSLNNRTGALRIYQNLARCLDTEFSIHPMPGLIQLYQSIIGPVNIQ